MRARFALGYGLSGQRFIHSSGTADFIQVWWSKVGIKGRSFLAENGNQTGDRVRENPAPLTDSLSQESLGAFGISRRTVAMPEPDGKAA